MDAHDRRLGMDRAITRRDFLNGAAITIGSLAATWLPDPAMAAPTHAPRPLRTLRR